MPIIKFDTPQIHNANLNSSSRYVNYLLKEDSNKGFKKNFFYNCSQDYITAQDVINSIDSINKQGLRRTDPKFFTGSINFSEEELRHINNDFNKIKSYTREVFILYAKQYNRDISPNDINWYAKIEEYRYFDGKVGSKQGQIKPGLHTHVHFLISRKTKSGNKISHKTNHKDSKKGVIKGGFNRSEYFYNCEKQFDNQFNYRRPINETYIYRNKIKNGTLDERTQTIKTSVSANTIQTKYADLDNNQKLKAIEKLALYMQYGISKNKPILVLDIKALQATEKANNYNGNIYKNLLKLNSQLKTGKMDYIGDVTKKIIDSTKNPYSSDSIQIQENKSPKQPIDIKDDISLNSINFNSLIIEPSSPVTSGIEYKEESKRKKRKGRKIN
nr:DUF5712 family protein [uncultured Carboxylicivirga sp.]